MVLQPEKVKFYLRLGQSKPIYNAFKAIQDSPDWKTLSEAQKRIVESEYSNFILSSEIEFMQGRMSVMALVIVIPVINNSHLYGDGPVPPNLAFFYTNKKKRDLLLVLELDAVLGKMQKCVIILMHVL